MMDQQGRTAVAKQREDEIVRTRLSTDYGEIANLTSLLNTQITMFVERINGMIESIPCQDTLAEIYHEGSVTYDDDGSTENQQVPEPEPHCIITDESMINSVDEVTLR